MTDGFVRMAAATPRIRVADPYYNAENIAALVRAADARRTKVLVLPELCLTGYTCGDLFLQNALLRAARGALARLAAETARCDTLFFVGLPLEQDNKLYNTAAAVQHGRVLGFVPKTHLPNYSEFYEARHFQPGNRAPVGVAFTAADGAAYEAPMGADLLFRCAALPSLTVGCEICEDLWAPDSPSIRHALAGATVLVNLSASDETTGKDLYRKALVTGQSARLVAAYVYADAGEGESTTDLVFSAHNLIAENGTLLAEARRFQNETVYADVDLERLWSERRRMTTFQPAGGDHLVVPFQVDVAPLALERRIDPAPFVPGDQADRDRRCEEILSIQAMGLKKRLEHTGCRTAVLAISGGLDSTLALLVVGRAFDLLGLDRAGIHAVTMPCFGTTDRTYQNACALTRRLGATLSEVDIREAVTLHFRDIGQDPAVHDAAYENSQARERTQVIMDLANRLNGLAIGTGDLSELALGWTTYNGDHMSMYGVNASVPKTLIRHLVRYCADTAADEALRAVLLDVLDTPVSPELLPPDEGRIAQKTEDIVGPYELHDFFLYYLLRFGYAPAKIFRLARRAFEGVYSPEVLLHWLKTFYRRFFSQQFKRSCLPDGPKVGSVAVSPRGDLRMPSDASARIWLDELERLGRPSAQ